MYSVLDAAMRACVPVNLAIGPPPDPADPWKHAVRADIADRAGARLVIRTLADVRAGDALPVASGFPGLSPVEGSRTMQVRLKADTTTISSRALKSLGVDDVFTIRLADPSVAAIVRPRHTFAPHHGVCQLTVTLDGIEPPIWRRPVVPAWFTLDKVHDVLQTALGWTNSHLHMFRFGDERVGTPYELGDLDETYTRSGRIVHVGDLVARGHRRVEYEYDFGDGWTHTIEIDDVRDEEGLSLACLDGARACPPEDCGGVHGYQRLLEILFDPTHQEFEDSRHWVGPAFDPERFDLRRVNQQLGRW